MSLNPVKNNIQLPPPKDWQDFERLMEDLWRSIWKDNTASLNGRGGQGQDGVDIFGRENGEGDDYIGIQCKGKDAQFGVPISEDELKAEVTKALGFQPQLKSFILVTTYQDDAVIQEVARTITTEHHLKGLFDVTVLGWGNLTQRITDHIDVLVKHWPQYYYLRSPVPEFKTRLENFYAHYLGTQQELVHFGGRDGMISDLDKWLIDDNTKPYRLLLAEAGRGKTSLLTRWSTQRSLDQDIYHVVFIPISIRFSFNDERTVFSHLLISLAELFNEDARHLLNFDVALVREACAGYLRKVDEQSLKILLIIDGLDEAKGWTIKADLLPAKPSAGLKVVISHRQLPDDMQGEKLLQRFNWSGDAGYMTRLDLLSFAGIITILQQTELHAVTDFPALAKMLYKLSEGDPLILCLYIDELLTDLTKIDLAVIGLELIKPGLTGYFDHWWCMLWRC